MYYNYNVCGQKRTFWYNDTCKFMTLMDEHGKDVCDADVKINDQGKAYFQINGETIMFDDFICPTPEEFVNNIDRYRDKDLCQILMKHGMDAVRVMMRVKARERVNFGGLVLSFDVSRPTDKVEDLDWVEYHFVNEDFSDPKDCYKLKMVPVDEKLREVYGYERTYVCDLMGLMQKRTDLYQVKANT